MHPWALGWIESTFADAPAATQACGSRNLLQTLFLQVMFTATNSPLHHTTANHTQPPSQSTLLNSLALPHRWLQFPSRTPQYPAPRLGQHATPQRHCLSVPPPPPATCIARNTSRGLLQFRFFAWLWPILQQMMDLCTEAHTLIAFFSCNRLHSAPHHTTGQHAIPQRHRVSVLTPLPAICAARNTSRGLL